MFCICLYFLDFSFLIFNFYFLIFKSTFVLTEIFSQRFCTCFISENLFTQISSEFLVLSLLHYFLYLLILIYKSLLFHCCFLLVDSLFFTAFFTWCNLNIVKIALWKTWIYLHIFLNLPNLLVTLGWDFLVNQVFDTKF